MKIISSRIGVFKKKNFLAFTTLLQSEVRIFSNCILGKRKIWRLQSYQNMKIYLLKIDDFSSIIFIIISTTNFWSSIFREFLSEKNSIIFFNSFIHNMQILKILNWNYSLINETNTVIFNRWKFKNSLTYMNLKKLIRIFILYLHYVYFCY